MTWQVSLTAEAEAELHDWPLPLRAALARVVERVEQVGLDRLGEPFAKHLEGKLWELRVSGDRTEGRALYVTRLGKRLVIVLAFQKKTRKTPRRYIDTALDRAKRIDL